MKPTPTLRTFLLGSVLLAAFPSLHAAALYWDGNDTTADADGGAGTWTTTDAWDTAATAGSNATWSTGSQAVFGGTAGTVTLVAGVTVSGTGNSPNGAINFGTSGYIVTASSAQTITLGAASQINGNVWTFDTNVLFDMSTFSLTLSSGGVTASEIKGVISGGTGNFTKGGGGEVALSGLNTYTGKTTVNQGILTANTLNNLSTSSSLGAPTTVANGTIALGATSTTGVLKYTGAATSTDRVINLNGTTGGATIDQSGNGLLKFTSAFTTTGRGSKTLTLTGSTAGTGEVAGAIVNAASGGTALATAFVAGASTVTLASVDGVSIGASITGTGIAGGTTVTAIDTGTKTVTLSANTTGTSGAVGSTYNVTGVLNLTSLTKNGSGTWTLSATNTFTGGVTINAGTLKLGNNSVIADAISSFTINGGTFDLATFVEGITAAITLADGTIAGTNTGFLLARGGYAGTGTNTISKRLSVRAADANSGLFNISSGTTTVSGIIYSDDSNVQGITKTGGGTLILGNAANSYTGATTINGGTLALDATGSIATSTSLAIAAGATLDTNSQTNYAIPAAQPVAFGIDATGSGSSGKITAAALDISSATVTYNITGTPDDPVYVLATYTSLSGTPNFLSVPAPPTGYTLNYAYEGNKIALVQTGGTTYADWLVANAPATGFDTDTDKDGIPNGVENVLGSNPNTYNAGLTEVSSTASSVVFKHTLNPTIASDVTYTYQWSTDLVEWKASTETNTGGTTATISPSAPVSGVVTVTITITGGPSSKLFGRLIAVK